MTRLDVPPDESGLSNVDSDRGTDAMASTLSKGEASELVNLIKTGRLFDLQKWIAGGKPIRPEPGVKADPLVLAVKAGFHSMVAVLASTGLAVAELNRMLAATIEQHRTDLALLLFRHGADPKSVRLADVLATGDPTFARAFIKHGSDVHQDAPFAEALGNGVCSILGLFKQLMAHDPTLISQAHEALARNTRAGRVDAVALMQGAGADPRAPVKAEFGDDPTTAMKEAVHYGHVEILKQFKPDPAKDDIIGLLEESARSSQPEMLSYLLDLHARSHQAQVGLGTVLNAYVERAAFGPIPWSVDYTGMIPATYRCLTMLAEHGLKWDGSGWPVNRWRHTLRADLKQQGLKLMSGLLEAGFFAEGALKRLMDTDSMKKLLLDSDRDGEKLRAACGLGENTPRPRHLSPDPFKR
jgi:hypothetical protein